MNWKLKERGVFVSNTVYIGEAPGWTENARVFSALYGDIPNLGRARKEFGATAVLLYCCPEITNAWCPGGTWKQVEEFIMAAHENGLHVICYYDTTLAEESFYPGHESWTQRNERGEPLHYQPAHVKPVRYAYCFNSPWSDRVQEIAGHYVEAGADGVFLDNPCYYSSEIISQFAGRSCFCSHCQEQFRQYANKDIFSASDGERIEWLKKSIQNHVVRVYEAMLPPAHGRSPVITCNSAGSSPTNRLSTLGPYENVLFRELFPGNPNLIDELKKERSRFPGKPLWAILTEASGSKNWTTDVDAAVSEFDGILKAVSDTDICPMIWSTIPSQDPVAPGFTDISIYTNPRFADVVKKYFLKRP